MTRVHSSILVVFGLCSVTILSATAAEHPEAEATRAVHEYLDSEIAKAANDQQYWLREWGLNRPLRADSIVVGEPYEVGRMHWHDMDVLVETGRLDVSGGYLLYFPIYQDGECVKLVLVHQAGGAWIAVGRKDWGMRSDSLAVAFSKRQYHVRVISVVHLGGVLVVDGMNGERKQVVPLGSAHSYLEPEGAVGKPLSYESAISILRERARVVVKEHDERAMEE